MQSSQLDSPNIRSGFRELRAWYKSAVPCLQITNLYRLIVTHAPLIPRPPDEEAALLVSRLTIKERECLIRWLNHETAKQIALTLGISHHAVEKRLKSARAKLGVGSSIEAAQMLARVEGYGQTVSQSSDLSDEASAVHTKRSNPLKIGALIMTPILAVLATIALQADLAVPPAEYGIAVEADSLTVHDSGQVDAFTVVRLRGQADGQDNPTDEELTEYLDEQFRKFDNDGNGSIESGEFPTAVAVETGGVPAIVHDESAQTAFLKRHD